MGKNSTMLSLFQFLLSTFILGLQLQRLCYASPTNLIPQSLKDSHDDVIHSHEDVIVDNSDTRSNILRDSFENSDFLPPVSQGNENTEGGSSLAGSLSDDAEIDEEEAISRFSSDIQGSSSGTSERSQAESGDVVKRHSERHNQDSGTNSANRRRIKNQRFREEVPRLPSQRPSPHNDSSNVVVLVLPSDTSSSSVARPGGSKVSSSATGYVSGTISRDLRFNSTTSSNIEAARLNKRRLIRGSRKAVTITRREYLKKDWCRTQPFQQVVKERGCKRKRIMNRFCYGQCNSFFIPKTSRGGKVPQQQEKGSEAFRSCAYCTPVDSEWIEVTLRCPKLDPPRKIKRVQIVKQCKCMAVNLDSVEIL